MRLKITCCWTPNRPIGVQPGFSSVQELISQWWHLLKVSREQSI
uniref:Uncharacterized protein n=1 Tax=Anguilla anguilla TaxID=7936 RepID=A0A0E9VND8_ANGAN